MATREEIEIIEIGSLPEASSIDGLYTPGIDGNNNSVKVPINLLKGNEGDSPVIGPNGNWWISGVDTGQSAQSVPNNKTIFNVSAYNTKYDYTDAATARNAVPSTLRGLGQIITYKLASGKWVTEQYASSDIVNWSIDTSWLIIYHYEIIQNEEFMFARIDANERLLFGHRWDGSTFIAKGIPEDAAKEIGLLQTVISKITQWSYDISVISNNEFAYAIIDKNETLLFAIRWDATIYMGTIPDNIKVELDKFALKEAGKSLIDSEVATSFRYITNPEYLSALIDENERLIDATKADGTRYTPKLETDNLTIGKGISFTDESISDLSKSLKEAGFSSGAGDYSDFDKIVLPLPRHLPARINIISEKLPTTKVENIKCFVEYFDEFGNYFKKPIILNAQGSSSMLYLRKNWAIDFTDCEVKFGSWTSFDSFHVKCYWIDNFRGQSNVSYNLVEQMYQSFGYGKVRPWDYLKEGKTTASNGIGALKEDFDNGALSHPDGFPTIAYWNGEFYGLVAWNIKKHRYNYNMSKSNAKHIILDGVLTSATLWNNTVDWEQFEIRNPKDLIDLNGNKYDGDNPKELSNTDALSLQVKNNIKSLSGYIPTIRSLATNADKKAEFERCFNLPFVISYFLHAQVTYNFDGFGKNWIWCTWDGVKWTPTEYDHDSVFGLHWKGTYIIPESLTELVGTAIDLPTGLMYSLYKDEVKAEYKRLRDNGIFSVDNIISLFEKWVNQFGYNNYKSEFDKWKETPSYRESFINTEYWQLYKTVNADDAAYPNYNPTKSYAVGEKCKYGKTNFYGFTCIKAVQGTPPFSGFYDNEPFECGCYNSIERVRLWLEQRISYLDATFDY